MAHRIDGRKLSRKKGPRLALYKNLTVSVLRYERVQTTEAKAKEIQGRVEQMITLAKRGDLSARRAVVAAFPNEPLVVTKLFDEIAPKYADRTSGYTRIVKIGPAPGRRSRDRPDRTRLANDQPGAREGAPAARPVSGSRHGRIRRHGVRRLPGPTPGPGPSRESSRPRWPASATGSASRSTGPAGPTPGCMPRAR